MASSSRRKKNQSKISVGDMDTLCDIGYRRQKAPSDVKLSLNMEWLSLNTWAMWETVGGVQLFNEVGQSIGNATEIITIHYDNRYGNFKYVRCNGRMYEVLLAQTLGKRDNYFLRLFAVEKGAEANKVTIL